MAITKRAKYVSKGTVGTNKKLSNSIRRDRPPVEVHLNKFAAFLKGRNVWFTIENPDPANTKARFIKVSGKDLYGDWRLF